MLLRSCVQYEYHKRNLEIVSVREYKHYSLDSGLSFGYGIRVEA